MKKSTAWLLLIALLLALTACGAKPTESEPQAQPPQEKEKTAATMTLKQLGDLQYYLYTPSDPEPDMPLILYLHGGTNKKADVTALLTTEGFPKYLYEGELGDLRAFVAIPKLESSYKGWESIPDKILALIDSLYSSCAINKNEIALTGHSMGGTGTYQLQLKLPSTFARIAPMSGSVQINEKSLSALSKVKIWAFVGTSDTVVDPTSSRSAINTLRERGADAAITELNGATHLDVPALAYKDPDLLQWLIGNENT